MTIAVNINANAHKLSDWLALLAGEGGELLSTNLKSAVIFSAACHIMVLRNQLAFLCLQQSSFYQPLIAKKPIYKLPTIIQISALVNSSDKNWQTVDSTLAKQLSQLSDNELEITNLKAAYENWIVNGYIAEDSQSESLEYTIINSGQKLLDILKSLEPLVL